MNNKIERAPTYGSVVTSLQYDAKIKRHDWYVKHKRKLIAATLVTVAAIAAIAVALLIV